MIRRFVNSLRSSETDISLSILNGLTYYTEHFQTVKKIRFVFIFEKQNNNL